MNALTRRPAAFALAALLAVAGACGDSPPAPPAPGTSMFVYAGGGKHLHRLRFDLGSGALTFVDSQPAGDDARIHELDVPRRRAYVQSQVGSPLVILTYQLEADGRLQLTSDQALPYPNVEGMTQIGIHPTAPWMLISATNASPGLEDQLLPLSADGTLGMPKTIAKEFYAFAWDPSGRYFYGLDGEAIFQFHFDAAGGGIAPNDPPRSSGSDGRTVLSLRNHPNGRWIYSVEEGAIGLHQLDATSGRVSAEAYVTNPVAADTIYWTEITLHPRGGLLYALGYLAGSRILFVDAFAIDPATGTLRFVQREKGGASHQVLNRGLQAPLVLDDHLIVGGPANGSALQDRPVLAVFRLDRASGGLSPVGQPTPLDPAATSAVNFLFSLP